jgi:hypothetical protein
MFIKTLIVGCIGLSSVIGTALATGHGSHSGDSKNNNKECTLIQTDSPKIHNKHCKPSPSPVITPKVTPTSTATPKSTPTSVSPKPVVTPAATPAVVPVAKSASQPAVLPSVGGTGKKRP